MRIREELGGAARSPGGAWLARSASGRVNSRAAMRRRSGGVGEEAGAIDRDQVNKARRIKMIKYVYFADMRQQVRMAEPRQASSRVCGWPGAPWGEEETSRSSHTANRTTPLQLIDPLAAMERLHSPASSWHNRRASLSLPSRPSVRNQKDRWVERGVV